MGMKEKIEYSTRAEWKVPTVYLFTIRVGQPNEKRTKLLLSEFGVRLDENVAECLSSEVTVKGLCHFRQNSNIIKALNQFGLLEFGNKANFSFKGVKFTPET